MHNGKEFVLLFNRLSEFLREDTGLGQEYSFSELINAAERKNGIVRQNQKLLRSFGGLRNAIIHDRDYPEKILADPRDSVLERFRDIVNQILSPEKVIPKFAKKLRVFDSTSHLSDALQYMKENDYSQVVAKDTGEYCLLTPEGIMTWLRESLSDDLVSLQEVLIEKILQYENRTQIEYLKRQDTVFKAEECFANAGNKGVPHLQAILITEHAKPQESPLGIITPWDIIEKKDE